MDHKELFDRTTYECSRLITNSYSTSFSLGIRTLDKKYHFAIYAIYGFVRYADEIVDTFHDKDKEELLKRFKEDTYRSIKEGISLNPVLHSFQDVVNHYQIDLHLIEAFLKSMEMDLYQHEYNDEGYKEYIYGSAEVVGLMCLKVFLDGDQQEYERLLPHAKSLGAAFQKVNFLRDLKSDFQDRGRVYFPGVDFNQFTPEDKAKIEADIQQDFDDALIGIKMLPTGSRRGVYLAYIYYLQLFRKIKSLPPGRIRNERIRVPDMLKMVLLAKTILMNRLRLV